MSIHTKYQNPTQPPATATTSDPKGKGKEKEVDPSVHEDIFDSEESGGDTWAEYPFERFPLPPGDESRNGRAPNATASLDPSLMRLTYPPPPPLADDPTWHAQMVAEVHRHRAHVNAELELAQTEAAKALADVTLAEVELKAERDKMQYFLNLMGSVAGKNFVRKMIRKVERSMKNANEKLDDRYEEELPDSSDYEDSSSNEDEVDHQDEDAEEEDLGEGAGQSEEGPDNAEDEQYSPNCDEGSCERFQSSPASCSPSSPDYLLPQYLHEPLNDDESKFWEGSELPAANESPDSSRQGISYQPGGPDASRGNITDDEYSSGEDDTSRKWTNLSPVHKSRKRHLEVEEDEETNSPEESPRKRFKDTPPPLPKSVNFFPLPTRCFYPPPGPDDKRDNAIDQDSHDDPDEEQEVEKSLTLEHEPVLLNPLERDPYRVRRNSRGEPELYIPGRGVIEHP